MKFVPQHIGMYDYVYLPYTEIIQIIKKKIGWSDFGDTAEHLDCELHDVTFYMNTLLVPNITQSTFHNSGLLRQGIITREEALRRENEDRQNDSAPRELYVFLKENGLSYEEYVSAVKTANPTQFESKIQKKAREIYHRFRKY